MLWLFLLPGLILYPCLSFRLLEPDEGRYAQIPREMLQRGEWVVPYLQGQPYLDKPPLMYWLTMVSYMLLGVGDGPARLAPALAVHGCILLVYLFGRRRLGERPAYWGALLLALMPGFVGMARLLLLDGVLTFLVTFALFAALESIQGAQIRWRWWLLAGAACGLGILTKGPVILILVLAPLVLHRWLTRSGPPLALRAWLAFLAVALGIALPWYVAICYRLPEFAHHFLWTHNLMRFFQPFDHIEPVWYYVPILIVCLLPGTLLAPGFACFLLTEDDALARRRPLELGYLLLAGGCCVLFFSLSGSKLPTYILPAFPPLALALGCYFAASRWPRSAWTPAVGVAVYAFMVAGNFWLAPWYAGYRSPMNCPAWVKECCADASVPVVCHPRSVDSVAFYTGRDDFHSYRSKEMAQLLHFLQHQERAVVLLSHRHSLEQLRKTLPPRLHVTRSAPLGLCEAALVEKLNKE
jgi:4-amino-4-deoxy-L-arabinose transferase-like glycosyltransferase